MVCDCIGEKARFSFLGNSEDMTFCDIEVHFPLCSPFGEFV